MRSLNSKNFHEKHTGVNRDVEVKTAGKKLRSLVGNETAALGIISLIIGVVMIIMIEMYVPSMIAPVDAASKDAVNSTGNAQWISLQAAQSTQAQSTVKSFGIVPQILGVVAVLSVLTMLSA
jgi:hypothetical protein